MAKGNGFNLTQREYADRRGVTQQAIAKLIRQGKLDGAFIRQGRQYRINGDKADAILASFSNPARAGALTGSAATARRPDPEPSPARAVAGGIISFAEAARREKLARAALLELALLQKRGELVERSRVEAAAAKLATIVRVGIEAIPAKVAPTVAGLKTAGDVARYLQGQFKEVLDNLSKGIADLDL
jgi:hypothetical protein